jgi:hypothetical protein
MWIRVVWLAAFSFLLGSTQRAACASMIGWWPGTPAAYWPFGPPRFPVCIPPVSIPPRLYDGYCGPVWFAPPWGMRPPVNVNVNVVVNAAPAYVPVLVPVPTREPAGEPASKPPSGECEGSRECQPALPAAIGGDDHPAVVVMKKGGIYSVSRYWVERDILYFVTTEGETLYVPQCRVQQVYPRIKNGRPEQ